jgi:glutaredoxin
MIMTTEKAILFQCPHCHVDLKAKLEVAGRNGRCPHCHRAIKVPEARESSREEGD